VWALRRPVPPRRSGTPSTGMEILKNFLFEVAVAGLDAGNIITDAVELLGGSRFATGYPQFPPAGARRLRTMLAAARPPGHIGGAT